MAQQQGVYEEFLEEQRRKRTTADDLEGEFETFRQEQERKRGAQTDPLDDLIDEFIASQRKARPAQADPLDDLIDEVLATPSPSVTPLPRPSSGRVLMPTERQEFGVRPIDGDTAQRLATGRRMKAETALAAKPVNLRSDWRTLRPLEEPVSKRPVQGPPVFKPRGETLKPRTMAKVGTMKPSGFDAAEVERRIAETVSDPSNASRFSADEWASMEAVARNVAERAAQEQRMERGRRIEEDKQLQKANAPSYPAQLVNRFMRGYTGTAESAIRGASLLHPAMAADLRQKGVLQTPQERDERLKEVLPADPTDESLLSKGVEVLGSAVPVARASALGGMAGLPSWIAPAVLGAATNAGQTYEDAVAAGENPERAKQAAIIGALIGLTEGAGVGRLGGKAPSIAARSGVARRIGLTAVKEFGEEGLQEAFNRALDNVNAKIVSGYAPERAIQEGVAESFLLGGFGGGALGGALGVATSVRPSRGARYRDALNAKPMEANRPPSSMIPPATPKQTEVIKISSGSPAFDSVATAPIPTTGQATPTARLPQIASEPQLGQTTQRLQAPTVRAEAGLPELSAIETAPTAPLKVESARASVAGPRLGEAALDVVAQSEPTKTPLRGRVSETVGGVQMAAQLGSPRFVIRNVLQHVAFGKQERAATRLAAALDWAYSKATGKPRQIAQPSGSDLAAYVRNWGKAVEAYKKGEPLPGRPNEDYLTADSNKFDRSVNKLMTWINEIPDAAQWQTRFEQSLGSIVGAAKKSKAPLDPDAAIDQAKIEADRASLRDPNFISTALVKLKQSLNTASSPIFGTDKFGVGDFVAKYVRTPGSLLKRGIERSPLGLFQVAKEAFTPGPFRRRNTLLALSRVAEGGASGLGLGAALAAARVLVGPEEESRTGRALEREEGVRGYSFNPSALGRLLTGDSTELREGDTLYSIDWAQPWAMNLSAGAALYNLHKRGEMGPGAAAAGAGEAIYDSLAKTLDVMGDQSVLKNLSRYMGRATGENFSDRMLNFAKAIGLDIPSSFVPSLARSARQVADPYERDTRAEERSGLRGFAEEATNRAFAQLPGLSQTLPTRPSVLTGEPKKTTLGSFGPTARVAAQISPANISTYQPHPIARETARLRDAGFEVSLGMPKRKLFEPTSVLREREMEFAVEFSDAAKRMIEYPLYDEYVDAVKAAALNNLAKFLRERTVRELGDRSLEKIITDAAKGVARRKEKEF